MSRDYAQQPINAVRRADRAVEDETWMRAFLHRATTGMLATVHEGQPFLNSNLYLYDEARHCIYIHTARVGRTRANIEQHDHACFSIMCMGRLLPADEALEFSVEYAGVTVFGPVRVIDDEAEATTALQALLDKYSPHLRAGRDYRAPVPQELARTTVLRLDIAQWSAKKKEVEEFPGAYWFDELPILSSIASRLMWRGQLGGISIAPAGGAPVQLVDEAQALAGLGLTSDRYATEAGTFSENGRGGRDITLVAHEDLVAIQAEGIAIDHAGSRRNLLTHGVPLNHLVGRTFRVGEAVLRGVRLCEPCQTLARSSGLGPALTRAMAHRGGLRADVIRDGLIQVGDAILPLD